MATVNLITVALAADSKVGESSSDAHATLNETLGMLTKADGIRKIQYGTQEENPDVLRFFNTWSSLEVHQTFHATSDHDDITKNLMKIISGPPDSVHVDFSVNPSGFANALSAPVTEVAIFSFENGPPAEYLKGAQQTLETWARSPEAKECGLGEYSLGLTHEELKDKEGLAGKRSVLVIGWESIEKHMAFRSKDLFKEHINGLRGGAKAIDMKHTVFKVYDKK